ncbi:hypothetical protein PybrP1_002365 [[Pythium] brassicae (nom. inval.)]|nr:hypothetical protein PybrP1_002365 [[Pythium] brassicae (nom. inval.)]
MRSNEAPVSGGGSSAATSTALALALGGGYAAVLALVNAFAPEPYMDEVFHIPQTQQYCNGDFVTWDSKITTLPGLYLVATLYAHAAALFGTAFCSAAVLRSVNVLFAVGSALLLVKLRALTVRGDGHCLAHALMVVAFPVHFFFTFLFYTDAGASFFVLLMYFFAERVNLLLYPSARGSFILSALTNIIWVAFVAGTVVVKCVELSHGSFIYGTTKQDARLGNTRVVRNSAQRVLINFVLVVATNLGTLLQLVWPFVIVAVGFAVFLFTNGGIVVGDKSNHEASVHGAQLLYFVVVAATGFGVSLFTPSNIRRFADSVQRSAKEPKQAAFMACTVALVLVTIAFFSPVHKFMLADNRHYTFYVWRKFFRKHALAKFLPTSLYLFFGWRCCSELRRNRTPLWMLVYGIAVALVLVPTPLVEPRYYLLPFILFHLNTGKQPPLQLWTTTFAYAVVNAITIFVFLTKPYTWVDGTVARFMW